MYSNAKTYLILFCGVFALSTSAIFVKLANVPSGVIAFYRLFLAGVALCPFLLFRKDARAEVRGLNGAQWGKIIAAGLFLALHYVMWFESLRFTSIASSTVLVSLQPLFSLALERVLLESRISATGLCGCAIALGGCVIIGSGDFQVSGMSLVGDVIAFLAAGVIALYFFIGQKVRQEISAVTYSVLSYFSSAVALMVYIGIQGNSFVHYEKVTWLAFLGLAVVSTIGGQFIFNLLLKKLPASAVTMSILGEPVGTCVLAYLFLHETISVQQLIGIVVIIGGLGIYFALPKQRKA